MVDTVRALKVETTDDGDSAALDPNQDGLTARAGFLQNDTSDDQLVYHTRVGDEYALGDVVSGQKTLGQLLVAARTTGIGSPPSGNNWSDGQASLNTATTFTQAIYNINVALKSAVDSISQSGGGPPAQGVIGAPTSGDWSLGQATLTNSTKIVDAIQAVNNAVKAGLNALDASKLTAGTVPSARVSGSYPNITGFGTITTGSVPASLVTGLAASATTDTTVADNIGSGTLPSGRISGTYAQLTGFGTITTGTVPVARVSGLAASATTDTTVATNITTGTLPSGRLSGAYAGITSVGTLSSIVLGGSTSGTITITAPATVTPYALKLPASSSVGFLAMDGSGNTSWSTATVTFPLQAPNGSDFSQPQYNFAGGGSSSGLGRSSGSGGQLFLNEFSSTGGVFLAIQNAARLGVTNNLITAYKPLAILGSTSGSVTLASPATVSSYTATLPAAAGTTGQVLAAADNSGGLQYLTPTAYVSSVALSAPSLFSVTGSPITTSGTLALAFATQAANYVLAGPTTGAAGVPTMRLLVPDDIPTIPSSKVSGLAASATTDTTNASNIGSGTLPSGRISGSYTGLTGFGTITTGSVPASLVSGLATSATTDTTNAGNITSGSLALARLAASGASSGQALVYSGSAWAPATIGTTSNTPNTVPLRDATSGSLLFGRQVSLFNSTSATATLAAANSQTLYQINGGTSAALTVTTAAVPAGQNPEYLFQHLASNGASITVAQVAGGNIFYQGTNTTGTFTATTQAATMQLMGVAGGSNYLVSSVSGLWVESSTSKVLAGSILADASFNGLATTANQALALMMRDSSGVAAAAGLKLPGSSGSITHKFAASGADYTVLWPAAQGATNSVPYNNGSGTLAWQVLAASATTDTTSASNISSGTLPTGRIAGPYTGLTGFGTITTGSVPASLITGLATSATTDTTNATNITSGTLAKARYAAKPISQIVTVAANTTITEADDCTVYEFANATYTVTLPSASTIDMVLYFRIQPNATATIKIATPSSSVSVVMGSANTTSSLSCASSASPNASFSLMRKAGSSVWGPHHVTAAANAIVFV